MIGAELTHHGFEIIARRGESCRFSEAVSKSVGWCVLVSV